MSVLKVGYIIAASILASSQVGAAPRCDDSHSAAPSEYATEVKRIIAKVAALRAARLDSSAKIAEQQRLFGELERLGPRAVPAIIEQMDDRRPLAVPQISLENRFPGAFEGVRHYGPELIVDALDALLNQITGESFGFIGNGGSEVERRRAVTGWRNYAAKLACKKPRR